jgi:zinc protease
MLLIFSLLSFFSLAADKSLDVHFPVEKFVLNNGLTVLLHEDRSIPMVSYHTWYRVGSRDEKPGVTGAAHMLEHMMFKGAKKYTDKEFDRILHANGIQNNAFTSWDYTGFYENLPSSKLELIMDVEVDRMRDLALKPASLTSELEVVGEERRWRVDNNPPSLLREVLFDTIFTEHPYHWPVIGYMKDIKEYTVEKLRHFYATYYVPNNAVLVIAGDIDVKKTKALVNSYYSSLPSRPLPERKYQQEPEQKTAKRKTIEGEVQNTSVVLAYKGVASGHPDSYALDLAANILGAGSSSRLYKKLVYQMQKATSAGAYNVTNADPGVILLMASMKPSVHSEIAEAIFREEIEKIKKNPVSVRELEKSKNQVMKDFVDGLTTIDGKAQALAVNEIMYNDYSRLFSDLKRYETVSVKDIQRVANTYLLDHRQVVGVLNPKVKKP